MFFHRRNILQQVKSLVPSGKKVMINLDSNHTHDHVFRELEPYAPMTTINSQWVVFDTVVEDLPIDYKWDRP
jgi:cephalosporin hydroxylase